MKQTILIFMGILLWAATASAQQSQYKLRHDSLYVYTTWEQIWAGEPSVIVLNPDIKVYTPYQVEFDAIKKDLRQIVNDKAVTVALGDSLWYINSKWLKHNFKGDCKRMRDYVPFYFSSKVAFVQWASAGVPKFMMQFMDIDAMDTIDDGEIYLLDFESMTVEKVDSDKLSELLSRYPDLRRRYEMMQDYNEPYMIADFFLQYVERIMQDPDVPYLF